MPHVNVHDLPGIREIGSVLARHGFGQAARLAGLQVEGEPLGERLPFGRRLRMVLADLGPTFVKIGQILSVRPDIVPIDVMEELATLQDHVPPAPFDEVRALLEGRFNVSFEDVRRVYLPAMRHRVILNFEAQAESIDTDHVLLEILGQLPEKADHAPVAAVVAD